MPANYELIIRAISFLSRNFQQQPSLEMIARHLNISPFHLQRTFTEWVGISPKRFLQFLTIDYARQLLDESRSVLDATYETGLSSPGRMHDLFVTIDAVTPGEYKARGAGLEIMYGLHESPFGPVLLAVTERGICGLSFHDKGRWEEGLEYLTKRWKNSDLYENPRSTQPYFNRIFSDRPTHPPTPLPVVLKGTNFQLKVWEALLRIPQGYVCSYQDIAGIIGHPASSRAVGNAIGANPVSFVIPCHRVIRDSGDTGNYHWNPLRKKAILVWEAAHRSAR